VKEKFPRLAYVTSDVIIRVGTQDFANKHYITDCYEYCEAARRNVEQDQDRRPALILVRNKMNPAAVRCAFDCTFLASMKLILFGCSGP
jgi:hypothetical protein